MRSEGYRQRLAAEQDAYQAVLQVHELPPIFHYWSNRYLRPMVEEFGFSSAEEFFAQHFALAAGRAGGSPVFLSLGAGNCDVEVRTAQLLRQAGLTDFVIECLELNPSMIGRGRDLAGKSGVRDHLAFIEGDFNRWTADKQYAAIAAHQSLHHVLELEHLFAEVKRGLHPAGFFVTDDMIGRNGHQRWPEALSAMRRFWHELPLEYRWNWPLKRLEEDYINHDCADEAFEGIRAQDVLPLLVRNFDFSLFIAFSNIIDVFIDRTFGWNFDASAEWDRDFVDRLHAFDEQAILDGTLTPTHMFAAMTPVPCTEHRYSRGLAPQRCLRREPHAPECECLTIVTPALRPQPCGRRSYSMELAASGGVPPYSWSAEGLPPSLALSPEGRLSGAIETEGEFTAVITLRDSASPPAVIAQRYTILNRASEQALQAALIEQTRLFRRTAWILQVALTQVKQWCRGYVGWKYTKALLDTLGTPPLRWAPTDAKPMSVIGNRRDPG